MKITIRSFTYLVLIGLFSTLSQLTFAHGGGLDSKGCHNDRKHGGYHCHRAQIAPAPTKTVTTKKLDQAANDSEFGTGRVHKIRNFRDAKDALRNTIYTAPEHQVGFYSGCRYFVQEKKLIPQWETCGYKPRKDINRASRIEWEHVMPAWQIGHQRQCWQLGKRSYCSKNDPYFAMAEADLHNLVPAIGELNNDRSNYRFTELGGNFDQYGSVPMRVDFKQRAVEPPTAVKGNIARTYFYMSETYDLRLSSAQVKLFEAWDKLDPVDAWECLRNERVAKVQGNDNPHVTQKCKLAGL